MGVAAYNRGSAVISRQIEADAARRPGWSARLAEHDHAMRHAINQAAQRLSRAMRSVCSLRATLTLERRRHAAVMAAIERTYNEARAAGLTSDDRGLYWLALMRDRAQRADPEGA